MNLRVMVEEKVELKTGYTTGSSATAAAKAALLSIINQKKNPKCRYYFTQKIFYSNPN